MKNKRQIILLSTSSIFILMFLFESTKEQIFNERLNPWESHWITIIFTTLISLIVSNILVLSILNIEKRHAEVQLKEEKLKSIKMVMKVVFHHVNNLANNLNIIKIEIEDDDFVTKETLDSLSKNIMETSNEMKRLYEIKNPLDMEQFQIKFN